MLKRLQIKPLTIWMMVLLALVFNAILNPPPSYANSSPASSNYKKVDPILKQALAEAVMDADSFGDEFDAQVWLVDMSSRLKRFIKDPKKRLNLLRMVHQEATRADLSPELVISVIHVESAFNPYAVSYVGAQGLMQVMPFWKKELGRGDDNLINAATNLRYGCTILKHYLKREKGDWIRALARYNGSLGRTKYPEKVMNFWQKYWFVDHQ